MRKIPNMYNYYLIILNVAQKYDCCGPAHSYMDSIIQAAIFGYARPTDLSIIIKSNQNLKYWNNFMEELKCPSYFMIPVDITKEVQGRSDAKTWKWIKAHKEEELSNQCTGFKYTKCDNIC